MAHDDAAVFTPRSGHSAVAWGSKVLQGPCTRTHAYTRMYPWPWHTHARTRLGGSAGGVVWRRLWLGACVDIWWCLDSFRWLEGLDSDVHVTKMIQDVHVTLVIILDSDVFRLGCTRHTGWIL